VCIIKAVVGMLLVHFLSSSSRSAPAAVNHLFDFGEALGCCVGGGGAAVGEGVDEDVTLAVDEVEQDEDAFPEEAWLWWLPPGGGGMMVTVGTVGLPITIPPPSVTE